MSAATGGFIAGMFVGGLVVFVMMSVIITASRADEREKRLFEEYLRNKRRFICIYSDLFGELPNCDGRCWDCRFAYEQREEEKPTMNEVREAFGFPPVEQREEENGESLHGDNQG